MGLRQGSCPVSRLIGEPAAAERRGSAHASSPQALVARRGVQSCPNRSVGQGGLSCVVRYVLHEKRPAGLSLVRCQRRGGDGHGGRGHKRREARIVHNLTGTDPLQNDSKSTQNAKCVPNAPLRRCQTSAPLPPSLQTPQLRKWMAQPRCSAGCTREGYASTGCHQGAGRARARRCAARADCWQRKALRARRLG